MEQKRCQLVWAIAESLERPGKRTEVVHDIRLAPLGSVRVGHRALGHACIEKQVIQLRLAKLLESFLCKGSGIIQI